MTDAGSETPHFDLKHRYAGARWTGASPCADARADVHTGPGTCTWTTARIPSLSLSRALGAIPWGNPFPSPSLPWTRCSPAAAAQSQDRYAAASRALPASGLNLYP